jgi:hypothetical protein
MGVEIAAPGGDFGKQLGKAVLDGHLSYSFACQRDPIAGKRQAP